MKDVVANITATLILNKIMTPFEKSDLFKDGKIDKDGKVLKSVGALDLLCLNLRKIFLANPALSKSLGTMSLATMFLFKESMDVTDNTNLILKVIDWDAEPSFADRLIESGTILEEIPANSVSGGVIDQSVYNNPPKYSHFAGCRVYDVKSDTYHKCVKGKKKRDRFSKYITDEHVLSHVREYAKKNPKDSIMVRDDRSGATSFIKFGKHNNFYKGHR